MNKRTTEEVNELKVKLEELFYDQLEVNRIYDENKFIQWTLEFNDLTNYLCSGRTNYTRNYIELDNHLVEYAPKEVVINTLIHELAHVIEGITAKHNAKWKRTFITLGGNGSMFVDVERNKITSIITKYL